MKFKSIIKMIPLIAVIAIFSGMFTVSCKSKKRAKTNDTVTTASGLRYVITLKNPNGMSADSGDKVEAHYTGYLTDSSKFDSSRDRNKTFSFVLGKHQVIKGWDEGFKYLKTGEKATLIIPPDLGYGSRASSKIPANSTLIFDVEMVGIKKPVPYTPFSGVGKDTVKLPSGLQYILIEQGDVSVKPEAGKTASIYYAGYFMDGKKFDGNFGGVEPFMLSISNPGVIEGWKEMIKLMNKGMKVRAIIPYQLAYGEHGYPGAIPPMSNLIFDMYMEDIK